MCNYLLVNVISFAFIQSQGWTWESLILYNSNIKRFFLKTALDFISFVKKLKNTKPRPQVEFCDFYFPINRPANIHFRRMFLASWWWSGACAGDAGPCEAEGTWSWNPVEWKKHTNCLNQRSHVFTDGTIPTAGCRQFLRSRQIWRQYTWSGRGTWPMFYRRY